MSQAQQRDRVLGPLQVRRHHKQIELGPMRQQAIFSVAQEAPLINLASFSPDWLSQWTTLPQELRMYYY